MIPIQAQSLNNEERKIVMAPGNIKSRERLKILILVVSAVIIALPFSSCSLRKLTTLNNYDDFAAVSNTFWASLYFTFADVSVPGYDQLIYKDTVWRKTDSPIVIDQNTYILPGVTVKIEPGAVVRLGKDVLLTCRGVIEARGTQEEPIRITWKTKGAYWKAIECLNCIRKGVPGPGRVIFEHCIIEHGGGILVNSSDALVRFCVFQKNIATPLKLEYAGGVITYNTVHNNSTTFQEETGNGGGINIYSDKKVRVEANQVYDNVSRGGRDGGGGIYAFAYSGGDVRVINNTVLGNYSDRKGGGIFAYAARITGNTVIDNQAAGDGGGIYAIRSELENNTISGNTAEEGGGIYSEGGAMINNLVRTNRAPVGAGLYHVGDGTIRRNSFVENSCQHPDRCTTLVVSGNPVLRQNNIIATDGYALKFLSHRLSPDLQAVDNYWGTADNNTIERVVYDWLENSDVGLVKWKPYQTNLVSGAHPIPAEVSVFTGVAPPRRDSGRIRGLVETDTELGGAGRKYIVDGNLLVQEGSQLTIRPGTELFLEKGVSIRVRGKLTAAGEKDRQIRFTGDDRQAWGQLFFENRSLDESGRHLSKKSLLRYCVVEHGQGILMDGQGADLLHCTVRKNRGTGIRIKEVPVSIMHCRIMDNVSTSDGGGVYVYGSKRVLLHDNEVLGNHAADGGGIFAYGYQSNAAIDIRDNRIESNYSQGDGGGVWLSRSAVVDNTIAGNRAESKGGGMYTSFALVYDNHIRKNTAAVGGGVYAEANSSLVRNTIEDNTCRQAMGGGGVYINYWGISRHNKAFTNNTVVKNRSGKPGGTGGVVLNGALRFRYNSIYQNTGIQLYNRNPAGGGDVTAEGCYWGTTAAEKIEDLIYDGHDDPNLSRVDYKPAAGTSLEALSRVDTEEK